MFVLLVELEANPGFSGELENILRSLVNVAEKEAETVFYAVHRPLDSANSFVLYELYKDRSAWDAHLQSELVQKELKQFEALLAVPPKITFCETILTTSLG
ncbi:MAG: antibiotic biosynthesis monooxygenase [Glaciimonas sp.]|nr:antibiotic biosynthesis monooxygenase [Glaciimonas sp.]